MNPTTGEIVHNPSKTQIAEQKLVKLSKKDLELLADFPDELKGAVWNGWREYKNLNYFKDIFQAAKAESAFYMGFLLALEATGKLTAPAEIDGDINYDQENIEGLQSDVGIGEESLEAKPIEGASGEASGAN